MIYTFSKRTAVVLCFAATVLAADVTDAAVVTATRIGTAQQNGSSFSNFSGFASSFAGSGGTEAILGNNGPDASNSNRGIQYRVGVFEFNIDAVRADIAAASRVDLSFEILGVRNQAPSGWNLQVFGTNSSSENGLISQGDANGGVATFTQSDDAQSIDVATISTGDIVTFDVTSIVQADGLEADNFSQFVVLADDPSVFNAATSRSSFLAGNATLTAVPEPGSMLLLGAVAVGGVGFRRRRKARSAA